MARQAAYSDPGLDLHQEWNHRMKSPQSLSKIQAKIPPASCCSKMLNRGLPDFTSTCFRNIKNWGSIAVLDDFTRDIIFTKADTKGDSIFETVLKLNQNCTMVSKAVFDKCVYCLTISSGFDVFGVELDKDATLETVFGG